MIAIKDMRKKTLKDYEEMKKKEPKKKIKKSDPASKKSKVIYFDTETAGGKFWYGGIVSGECKESYFATNDFDDFFKVLTDKPAGRTLLAGAYNHSFDAPLIAKEMHDRHNWHYNPMLYTPEGEELGAYTRGSRCYLYGTLLDDELGHREFLKERRRGRISTIKGVPSTIYSGQTYEVYGKDVLQPLVRIFDTRDIMGGGRLESHAPDVGLSKLTEQMDYHETDPRAPIFDRHWEYLYYDVEIMRRKMQAKSFIEGERTREENVKAGYLTTTSVSYAETQGTYKKLKNEEYRERVPGIKTVFGARAKKKQEDRAKPLPTSVGLEIERDIAEARRVEEERSQKEYTTSEDVWKDYTNKLRNYYSKRLNDTVESFKELQDEAWKALLKKEHDKEKVERFWALECPKATKTKPQAEKYIDAFHYKCILHAMNKRIHPAMRGGISQVKHGEEGKIQGRGFVIDAISMYPSVLETYTIPCKYVGSDFEQPDLSKYCVVEIKVLKAKVKPNAHPWLKGSTRYTKDKFYGRALDWGADEDEKYALTNQEIIWLRKTYDIEELEFGQVFYFEDDEDFTKSIRAYISKWGDIKRKATREIRRVVKSLGRVRNKKKRQELEDELMTWRNTRATAKERLNTIWGRWGMVSKSVEQGGLTTEIGDKDTNLVSAIFTTAIARIWLNRLMNSLHGEYIYCDTDSIHGIYTDRIKDRFELVEHLGDVIDSEGERFGAWEPEEEYDRAIYIKPKTYAHESYDEKEKTTVVSITAAGIDASSIQLEKLEDFGVGFKATSTKSYKDEWGTTQFSEVPYEISL